MKVVILRGLPGAGKTTWVKTNLPDAEVCSADHHLYEPDGTYNWTLQRLYQAHSNCMSRFMELLAKKAPLVVIDNCNLLARDFSSYIATALDHQYEIEIRTLKVDPAIAQARGLHKVPSSRYKLLMQRLNIPLPQEWLQYEVQQ